MALDLTTYQNEDKSPLGPAPAGEYELAFVKFKKDDDAGIVLFTGDEDEERRYIMPFLEVVNHPDAHLFKEFNHYLGLPADWMSAKEKQRCLSELDAFGKAFGIDMFGGQIDEEDFQGRTCAAILTVQESEVYGDQNRVKQFLVFK